MNEFFWVSGHLGWGAVAFFVFTGLWWLLADLVWRLTRVGIKRLAAAMLSGWIFGAGLIFLTFYLGNGG